MALYPVPGWRKADRRPVSLVIGGLTPTTGGAAVVEPAVATATITSFAPSVVVSDHKVITPGVSTATITSFSPTVNIGVIVTPAAADVTITSFAPALTITDHKVITPEVATATITSFAPSVVVSDHKVITPGLATATITSFAPSVVVAPIGSVSVTPGVATVTIASYPPTVEASIDEAPIILIGGDDAPRKKKKTRKERHELFRDIEATVHELLHPAPDVAKDEAAPSPLATGTARQLVDELAVLAERQHQLIQRAAALRAELAQLETARREQEEEDEFLMFV